MLTFWNTDLISLTPGAPNSIYDANGAALAVYRPGSGGSGLRAACAILAGPPGAPDTGNGTRVVGRSDLPWSTPAAALGLVLLTTSAVVGAAVCRRSR